MQQQVVSKGNRAVVITEERGRFAARLYVNARDGIANASATLTANTFKSAAGANRWAAKQVAA
ncbi:hypothetical protein [Sphingomonas sp. Leaf10]|uniref:hypothetical protein n=1 Tax=Sphingomonas sp. Leaf10 TaxID=1735676 RepID=UPI0006FFC1E6|nr:hypothetical protein [Sphingomonas sp. Leaf10]KQM37969.1 hypothetical protein ASE59_11770 [Sphingomonas sp. Leaf10]